MNLGTGHAALNEDPQGIIYMKLNSKWCCVSAPRRLLVMHIVAFVPAGPCTVTAQDKSEASDQACKEGDLEVFKSLLREGADIHGSEERLDVFTSSSRRGVA